jgi:ABC-2 type transport system ATP-binding protein
LSSLERNDEIAISVEGLSKQFGSKKAVNAIDFRVNKGEVFGFLGPNGAGKSTTIKMLTTLIPPSGGRASVLGFDLRTEGKRIREKIGVVQQQDSFDQGLKTETSLDLYGLVWDVPKAERRKRIATGTLVREIPVNGHVDGLTADPKSGHSHCNFE